jgi:DNA-binding beta-propeller fold protein YncE
MYKQTTTYLASYAILALAVSCNFTGAQEAKPTKDSVPTTIKDTIGLPKPYSRLVYDTATYLASSAGTKSVLFNAKGSKLYAMNLEALSVYEFDQATKKVHKVYKFKPTKGIGWDYVTHQHVPSYEEKPVEACLSHNDKILWVSLHNAAGVVPIKLDSMVTASTSTGKSKKLYIINKKQNHRDSTQVPLIATGKTPKVIARTADSKYLLVSNWHSNSVSVLEMNDTLWPYGKVIKTIPVTAIPRGIVVDDKHNKTYVAIMGGRTISVIDNNTWAIEKNIAVASTPRHIVMDTSGHLFVSYNSLGKIGCIDIATEKTLFTASTNTQPRTIVLSKNHQFLFVTCYTGNTVDVFKINKDSFSKIYSLECKGKPVGVDVYEDDAKLEAWVCNYVGGSLKVFSFKKE